MKQISFTEEGSSVLIHIPSNIYSKEAILNYFYWKLAHWKVLVSSPDENSFIISINLIDTSSDEYKVFRENFSNDLLDFELREIVNKETKNTRELIIAKAFSNGLLDDLKL